MMAKSELVAKSVACNHRNKKYSSGRKKNNLARKNETNEEARPKGTPMIVEKD